METDKITGSDADSILEILTDLREMNLLFDNILKTVIRLLQKWRDEDAATPVSKPVKSV